MKYLTKSQEVDAMLFTGFNFGEIMAFVGDIQIDGITIRNMYLMGLLEPGYYIVKNKNGKCHLYPPGEFIENYTIKSVLKIDE